MFVLVQQRNALVSPMPLRPSVAEAVRSFITVPEHIKACAGACLYDLMHGPSYTRVPKEGVEAFTRDDLATYAADLEDDVKSKGGTIHETYTGPVSEAVRGFIDTLPSELWVDDGSDFVMTAEPEGYEDEETGEFVEPFLDETYHLDGRAIREALFGATFAREFS